MGKIKSSILLPWLKCHFRQRSRSKLDYPQSPVIPDQGCMTRTQIFKSSYITKSKQNTEWQRATEGFSGFSAPEPGKLKRRKSLPTRQPQKYTICMPCDSESDGELEVENVINWNSSDEDLSPVSDIETNAEASNSCNRQKKMMKKDKPFIENIDLEDSDTEEKRLSKTSDNHGLLVQDEADLIEDTDSRSSFTMSGTDNSRKKKNDADLVDYENIEIPSSTEASATSRSPSQRSKVKASDWVKSLDLKTPTKQQSPISMPSLHEDSAKKKRKYLRNGLADQLYRLQIRERSAVRVWNHQAQSAQKVSSKSVMVKVLEYEMLHSLQLAKCRDLTERIEPAEYYVLFSAEMTEELNISIGTVVRIFPPWQKLELQSLKRNVILCTNYVRIEDNKGRFDDLVLNRPEKATCTAEWKCPCVTGLVQDYKLCPASQYPCIPGIISQENKDNSYKSGSEPSQTEQEHSLYMIQATQSSTESCVTDSILNSIDKSSLQDGVSFRALVHRVFCKIDMKSAVKRYSLLVEDGHGIMCEIEIPHESEKLYGDVIKHGEKNSYMFGGLKVLSRITRDRDPALFSMIDSVWSGINTMAASDESETASCSNTSQILPPGFCYSMSEHSTSDLRVSELSTPVTNYKNTQLSFLRDVKQEICDYKRLSLRARVVTMLHNNESEYEGKGETKRQKNVNRQHLNKRKKHLLKNIKKKPKQSDLPSGMKIGFKCLLYVTDHSIEDYTVIRLKQSCCLQRPTFEGNVLLRDILLLNGYLVCDCYSEILSDQSPSASKIDIKYEIDADKSYKAVKLTENSDLHDLCTVKGIVSEVDESSAYSWDACDRCGLDRLAEKPNTIELVCLSCKRVVYHPLTKMKMEVYVLLSHMKHYRVKVDLTGETIKSLLPDEENNEEGYDIDSVQNSTVGPINCVVLRKDNMEISLKEIKTFI